MSGKSDYVIRITAENEDLKKKLAQTRSLLSQNSRQFSSIAAGMQRYILQYAGWAAVVRGLSSAVGSMANFEFQMDKVAAVSGASAEEIKKLTANALELGAKSQYTATQIGELQEELARLGFSTDQIVEMTDAARKLATVTDEELAPSAKAIGQVINAFDLEAKDASRVANVMAESFSKSALDLENFTVGMSYAATAGKNAGFSLEQVTAMLGKLVDAGIDGSKAGTALRDIFSDLSIKGISLNDALDKIRNSSDKNKTAFELFGKVSMNAAVILADQSDKVKELTGKLADNTREMDKMVGVMEDNLITDWKLFTSAVDGLLQKGTPVKNFFRKVVQGMTEVISTSRNLADNIISANAIKSMDDFNRVLESGVLSDYNQQTRDLVKSIIAEKEAMQLQGEGLEAYQLAIEDGVKTIEDFIAIKDKYIHYSKEEEDQAAILKTVTEQYAKSIQAAAAASAAASAAQQKEVVTLGSLKEKLSGLMDLREMASVGEIAAINDQIEALKELIKKYEELSLKVSSSKELKSVQSITSDSDTFKELFKNTEFKGTASVNLQLVGLDDYKEQDAKIKAWSDHTKQVLKDQTDSINGILENSLEDGIAGFAEGLGTGGLDTAFQNLFEVIGTGLQTLGKALIGFGVSMEAFKEAFTNPYVAIAAGAAAIALGAAVKQSAANLSASATGGSTSSSSSGSTSDNVTRQNSIRVEVTGKLTTEGNKLVSLIQSVQSQNQRRY